MIAGQSSRTAQYVAFFRALETQRRAADRLFDDPMAQEFLDGHLAAAARLSTLPPLGRLIAWLVDRRVPGPRASAIARTRYLDDAMTSAIGAGVRQVVLLGAGFDTRAYRLPALRDLPVFEVDHPDTQQVKRGVVGKVLSDAPSHVTFVALDFETDPLAAALTDSGLRVDQPTLFLWEGVASYLAPESVDATITSVRDLSSPGSELLLTYVHRGLIEGTVSFPHSGPWQRAVQRAGEPFVFGFDPSELPGYLGRRGWTLRDDQSTSDVLVRYLRGSPGVPAFYRIAHATRTPTPSPDPGTPRQAQPTGGDDGGA